MKKEKYGEWIPVTERLPEDLTAWMPLPEPYKGDTK